MSLGHRCTFVPPYLLERIASSGHDAADHCRTTLATDQAFRAQRETAPTAPAAKQQPTAAAWVVHTAANGSTLPGERGAHAPATRRPATRPSTRRPTASPRRSRSTATSTAARPTTARAPRSSLTVHYEQDYDNAFWNGTQLVFGDGDGTVFGSLHQADRRARPRAHPRGHPVHRRPHLPGPVGRAQRVGLRRASASASSSGCSARPPTTPTGWSARASSCRGHQRAGAARHGAPRHGVRRPARWARTRRSGTWRTTSTPPTTTAACTPTPASPTAPSSSRPPRSAATPGAAPAGSGTTRSPAAGSPPTPTSRASPRRPSRPPATTPTPYARRGRRSASPPAGSAAPATGRAPQAASVVAVRRTGGLAGPHGRGRRSTSSADDPRAAAARDLVGRLDLSSPVQPEAFPDAFSYTFEVDGRSVTVPQQHLTDEQRALADLLL